MRVCLGLSFLLAAPLGCFSEPPESSDGSGGSSSSGGAIAEGSGEATVDPSTSETSSSGSSETETGTAETSTSTTGTGGSSSSTSAGPSETTDTSDGLLLDIYEDCDLGDWQSSDGVSNPEPVVCLNNPNAQNNEGGAWRYSMYPSPEFGMQTNALILRPFPNNDGSVSVSFNAGQDGFDESAHLVFDYEFVNTDGVDEISMMGFQAFVDVGDGSQVDFVGDFGPDGVGFPVGRSGTVDLDTGVMGGGDELVFFLLSNVYVEGQGVALYNARIVTEG